MLNLIDTRPISNKFPKKEKLVSQKSIDKLFSGGKSFIAYPLRVVYCFASEDSRENQLALVLTSVSKRKFKRAVKRNRVKRLIREAYRLNKHDLMAILPLNGKRLEVAFLFLKDELPEYTEIEKAMKKAINTLKDNINHQ